MHNFNIKSQVATTSGVNVMSNARADTWSVSSSLCSSLICDTQFVCGLQHASVGICCEQVERESQVSVSGRLGPAEPKPVETSTNFECVPFWAYSHFKPKAGELYDADTSEFA